MDNIMQSQCGLMCNLLWLQTSLQPHLDFTRGRCKRDAAAEGYFNRRAAQHQLTWANPDCYLQRRGRAPRTKQGVYSSPYNLTQKDSGQAGNICMRIVH